MKSSLKKLRGLATLHKNDGKEKKDYQQQQQPAQLDELAQASQDMQDMRNCYDSLLSAAAATANSAYEFSEALREMGSCLLEKTALIDDEESSSVLLKLGKVQFELQKLVDSYRSHTIQTITTPSESLLNELRTVEEMKRQCDEKREVFEYMLAAHKDKGKSRNTKGETVTLQQLQAAQEDYDEEATLFVFRLKSLKQGQSRSLLTQAARHHAAQLNFFRKGNQSLEAIEPHVKLISEQQHIDYQFCGLDDDGTEDDDNDYAYDANDDGELSFDYGQNEQGQEAVSTSRNSMELDPTDHTSAPVSTPEAAQENLEKSQADFFFNKGPRPGSQSAPIFPDKKSDPAEKFKEMQPSSTRKFHTYVLPTPVDLKGSNPVSSGPVPVSRLQTIGGWPTQLWHSSPLGPDKNAEDSRDDQTSVQARTLKQSVLTESNTNSEAARIPPPLAEGLSYPRLNSYTASDTKKIKRQAYSGPLTSKAWPSKPIFSVPSMEYPPVMSSMPLRVPTPKSSTSPKVSPSASPPLMSSPKISELHELPRPPLTSAKPTRPPGLIGHSAPLLPRGPELSATTKTLSVSSHMASPLPIPPGTMPRSFSIPSSGQRTTSLAVSKLLEAHHCDMTEEVASPPLATISFASIQPVLKAAEDAQAAKFKSES